MSGQNCGKPVGIKFWEQGLLHAADLSTIVFFGQRGASEFGGPFKFNGDVPQHVQMCHDFQRIFTAIYRDLPWNLP